MADQEKVNRDGTGKNRSQDPERSRTRTRTPSRSRSRTRRRRGSYDRSRSPPRRRRGSYDTYSDSYTDYSDSFVSDDSYKRKNVNRKKTKTFTGIRNKGPSNLKRKGTVNQGGRQSKSKQETPRGSDAVMKRMLSARRIKINELKNEVEDISQQLIELKAENKTLRRQQFLQEKALVRFEDKENDLPLLLERHSEEVRTLREQLRKQKDKYSRAERKLKDTDDELSHTKKQLKKMKGLVEDKNLGERDELSRKLTQVEIDLEDRDKRIKDLEKHMDHLKKNHRHELGIEIARHRETMKRVDELQTNNERLLQLLKEKEKEIEIKNIYANRAMRPPHRLPSSSSTPLPAERRPPRSRKNSEPSMTPREKAKMFEMRRREEHKKQLEEQRIRNEQEKDERDRKNRERQEEEERRRRAVEEEVDEKTKAAKAEEEWWEQMRKNEKRNKELEDKRHEEEEMLRREREEEERRMREERERRKREAEELRRKQEQERRERAERERREREEEEARKRQEEIRARKERDERENRLREERERKEREEREKREREERERQAELAHQNMNAAEQERRRQKDLLLARMREIDENKMNNMAATPPARRKNSVPSESKKKDYNFTQPIENMHHGKPAYNDVHVPVLEKAKKRNSLLDNDDDEDSGGGYIPTFAKSDKSGSKNKTSFGGQDNPSSKTKSSKKDLMDELFGSGKSKNTKTTKEDDELNGFISSDKKTAPSRRRQPEGSSNTLFEDSLDQPSNGSANKLLPRRPMQQSTTFQTRPAVNAIDDVDDEIEEVIL